MRKDEDTHTGRDYAVQPALNLHHELDALADYVDVTAGPIASSSSFTSDWDRITAMPPELDSAVKPKMTR